MSDVLRRLLFTGLGALVITKDKMEDMVSELVSEGEISEEEGKNIVNNFVSRAREEREKIADRVRSELEKQYGSAGLASKKEVEKLRLEVRDLSAKVRELKQQLDE